MKIVHSADWHIGKFLNDFSLLEDQQVYFDRLLEQMADWGAQVLLVAGDIYDRSMPSAEAVELLDRLLLRLTRELKVKVMLIAGNHDSPTRLSFASRLYRESGLYVCGKLQKEVEMVQLEDEYGPVRFYLLPYLTPVAVRLLFSDEEGIGGVRTYNDAFSLLLSRLTPTLDLGVRNVLVTHGFFENMGTQAPQLLYSDSEVTVGGSDLIDLSPASGFDYVALGHLHAPQRIGSESMRYSGSPLKYSVSEAGQKKSAVFLELLEKGTATVMQREIAPLRDLRVVQGSFEELSAPTCKSDDYIFANLTDDTVILDVMNQLRRVYPNILGLKMLAREQEREAVLQVGESLSLQSPEELFCAFYRSMKGEEISDKRRELVQTVFESLKERTREE